MLLVPSILILVFLYLLPLGYTLRESFKIHEPGRVGGLAGSFTAKNYLDFLDPAYLTVLYDTFFFSFVAAAVGVLLSYPLSYYLARGASRVGKKLVLAVLVAMLFSGAIVRVYSISLTFGAVGIFAPIARFFDISLNGIGYIEATLIIGLLNFVVPVATLTLLATINNIDPRLEEAAQSLGAPRWFAFWDTTFRLSLQSIISVALLGFAVSISAFIVPLILGRGIVVFTTNLIFSRFAEIADHPSGAAVAVILLVISVAIIQGAQLVLKRLH
ncbi:ABC transporter permease subunit [Mesorhizobium sp. KR1-2]|uniref:ABC transporter permease n=1 Tax=Mesorhizobium sp. KR1-2 TaxID=3156609 RepID=UPI0032B53391